VTHSTLTALIEDLRDAQRYAGDWNLAREEVPKLADRISLVTSHNFGLRVAGNLYAALELVVSAPSVLRGYLAGAVAELEAIAENLQKEGERVVYPE
jgi:hypothetical protein